MLKPSKEELVKAQQLALIGRLSSTRYDNMDIELLTVCYFSLEPQRSVEETTKCLGLARGRTQTYGPGFVPMQSLHGEVLSSQD